MTDIPIPPEVVEALRKRITDSVIHISTAEATAALRAALAAWPGMIEAHHPRDNQHALILPLPQESSDDH